jgi:hypothetical protein
MIIDWFKNLVFYILFVILIGMFTILPMLVAYVKDGYVGYHIFLLQALWFLVGGIPAVKILSK